MWQFCTRKLWNCPMLWLWSGSGRQYRSREIARWNQTGEPSATGLERRKNPNKTSYLEIHQQGAEFCLALKDTLLFYLIWKSAWEFEGGWAAYLWGEGFVTVWILFHYPRGQTEGAERGREKDIPSVPCSRGMDWEGKWLALGNDQEKPMYSIHGGCLGSFMLS